MGDEVFTKIYEKRVWGQGSVSSPLSGPGSTPDNALPYVDFVKQTIDLYAISNVFDFGHGDWAMWRDYKFENTNYTGVDVVFELSKKNQESFGSQRIKFLHVEPDYVLPNGELLICKEVLQHLSQQGINDFLSQISKFEFLIICNEFYRYSLFSKLQIFFQFRTRIRKLFKLEWPFYAPKLLVNNSEIETGSVRGLDLEAPIFDWAFLNFDLIQKFDFDTQNIKGIKQRVLFYKRRT